MEKVKRNNRLRWGAVSITGIAALILTLWFTLGGRWNSVIGRVYAVEKKTEVHDTELKALKESLDIIREDGRETRMDVKAIREHLMK